MPTCSHILATTLNSYLNIGGLINWLYSYSFLMFKIYGVHITKIKGKIMFIWVADIA